MLFLFKKLLFLFVYVNILNSNINLVLSQPPPINNDNYENNVNNVNEGVNPFFGEFGKLGTELSTATENFTNLLGQMGKRFTEAFNQNFENNNNNNKIDNNNNTTNNKNHYHVDDESELMDYPVNEENNIYDQRNYSNYYYDLFNENNHKDNNNDKNNIHQNENINNNNSNRFNIPSPPTPSPSHISSPFGSRSSGVLPVNHPTGFPSFNNNYFHQIQNIFNS